VLTGYDERAWPRHYARRHYRRTGAWRRAVDAVLADRILRGDAEALTARLDAFASVGEQLTSLLTQLAKQATTASRGALLHAVWPQVLDRLLPANRDLTGSGGHHQQPYHRDVDALNEALLLVPPEGVTDWPWTRTMESGARWIAAFTGHAGLADRVITFVGKLLGLRSDLAISLVLRVLGNDVKPIRRQSQYTVAFLHAALRDPPPGTAAAQARVLLDRLAGDGDDHALQVQQELEATGL